MHTFESLGKLSKEEPDNPVRCGPNAERPVLPGRSCFTLERLDNDSGERLLASHGPGGWVTFGPHDIPEVGTSPPFILCRVEVSE